MTSHFYVDGKSEVEVYSGLLQTSKWIGLEQSLMDFNC